MEYSNKTTATAIILSCLVVCIPAGIILADLNIKPSHTQPDYKRLYLECNTKIKNDSTHKDCVYKIK